MTSATRLEIDLQAARARSKPVYLAEIRAAGRLLQTAGTLGHVRKARDIAPDFALAASNGTLVGLRQLLRSGPVVISFYRGEWCPFCQAELDALLEAQPAMAALDATLLLIGPEAVSAALTAKVEALGDRVWLLRDNMMGVALQFGLVYLVPAALRDYYIGVGFDLSRDLSTGSWLLPLAADFIVGPDGRIVLAWADADFTQRLDPALIVESLSAMRP